MKYNILPLPNPSPRREGLFSYYTMNYSPSHLGEGAGG